MTQPVMRVRGLRGVVRNLERIANQAEKRIVPALTQKAEVEIAKLLAALAARLDELAEGAQDELDALTEEGGQR